MGTASSQLPVALSSAEQTLVAEPRRWLVTGAAGFIGSHLVERLLGLGQHVTAFDNFATGHESNLAAAEAGGAAAATAAHRPAGTLRLVRADIRDADACAAACANADVVLHQAALGSVPRSVSDPLTTHAVNVDGFVTLALAARDAGVERFVYASSSSVYGDSPDLPKVETRVGTPLSPYAVSKRVGELYADTFARHYGLQTVGLRYFNVFGPRQDPAGAYAAVVPRWTAAMLRGEPCLLHGDGRTSRDFCYVANVVQANLLAATAPAADGVFNVAVGERTTLADLHTSLAAALEHHVPGLVVPPPTRADERPGDIPHSLADVTRAVRGLGYAPTHTVRDGLAETAAWYVAHTRRSSQPLSTPTV